ncbi:MAG: SGNH/GDSL hydrolase family protein [Bacteroidetes bacterium]|nr:MAG: SGNH/GDSL hydrolase family protein [Bacteroidota bacterium]
MHLFCLLCLLLAGCANEAKTPQKIASKPDSIVPKPVEKPKPITKMNTDTTKPLFKTVSLAPLKTGMSDWQASLTAGKLKVVCYGNSITNGFKVGSAGKVANPYPETLAKLLQTRYPQAQIIVKNEGHNGWRADQALNAVGKLVLPEKPDWVVLELGINDAYSNFSPAVYVQYMKQLVQTLKQNNIKVLLLTATPIATKYHEKVLAYHAPLRALAESEGCAFLDLSTYIAQRAEKEQFTTETLLPDDVHLADDQYAWIADAIMTLL